MQFHKRADVCCNKVLLPKNGAVSMTIATRRMTFRCDKMKRIFLKGQFTHNSIQKNLISFFSGYKKSVADISAGIPILRNNGILFVVR